MTSERAFRGALLRVCRELGEETWTSFCFLWALPERVEEGGRSDVLRHLLQSGQLSCERPAEVAKLFRQELSRDDLAVRFEDFLSEGEAAALVETREGVKRGLHGSGRRHGRHLTLSQLPDLSEQELEREEKEEEEAAPFLRQRTTAVSGASRRAALLEKDELFRQRQGSVVSTASSCSSGYFSQRHSSVASRSSMLSLRSHDDAELEETEAQRDDEEVEEGEGERTELNHHDSIPRSASFHSSSSSSTEDELQLGLSTCCSLSSLSTTGSLPRGITRAPSDLDLPDNSPSQSERSEKRSEVIVNSPTHSSTRKTDTMFLRSADLMSDINLGQQEKAYCSSGPRERSSSHGISFKMKFCPTNHEGSSAALYVTVSSHLDKKVIPPLDISVSVHETDSPRPAVREPAVSSLLEGGQRSLLASGHRTSRGNFVIQGQFTALFSRLIDHRLLRQVTSEYVAVQVVMEYSAIHPGGDSA